MKDYLHAFIITMHCDKYQVVHVYYSVEKLILLFIC